MKQIWIEFHNCVNPSFTRSYLSSTRKMQLVPVCCRRNGVVNGPHSQSWLWYGDFDADDWEGYYNNPKKNEIIRMKRNKFMESIDKSLQCFLEKNLSVQEFNLSITYCNDDYGSIFTRIDQWLCMTAKGRSGSRPRPKSIPNGIAKSLL